MLPNERDAIHGMPLNPSQTVFPTVVYRRYSEHWHHPMRNVAGGHEQPGPDPRAAAARAGRRPPARALQEPGHALQAPALDALPRRALPAELGRRVPAGLLGPRRRRQARARRGPTGSRPAPTRSACGPTTTTRRRWRTRSPAGCTGCCRSSARTSSAPDREFEVVFAPMGAFQTIDGRAFVGNTPVFTSNVGQTIQWDVMAMGSEHHTFHVHGHRWMAPDGTRRDTQTVGPRRDVPHPLEGAGPRHVALPLPRRVTHDGRDDRHLPGQAPMRRRPAGGRRTGRVGGAGRLGRDGRPQAGGAGGGGAGRDRVRRLPAPQTSRCWPATR